MGLAWQQGPLAVGSTGHFLTPEPLPERLLFVEPLRRRMRVRFGDAWIADSEDVLLLHEPGHYPVAFFPISAVTDGVLEAEDRVTQHRELGATRWFTAHGGDASVPRGAWQYSELPAYADALANRVAFAWRAMDAFYEEDERIVGHAADPYHRIDIRRTSRHLVVKDGDRVVVDTIRPLVLFESGFAPRWYVPREDIDESALTSVEGETFCPYKGLASYYAIGGRKGAGWYYPDAWDEVASIRNMVSFEADQVDVFLDGEQQHVVPGQTVIAHGLDRGLDPEEIAHRAAREPAPAQ
jgi:uncharacterized protein (DUF427 family)